MLQRLSPIALAALVLLLYAPRAEAVGIVDQTDPHQLRYRIEGGPLRELAARFTPNELQVLEKLNRTDLKHLPRLDRIVVPSEWRHDIGHSPFPATYPAATATPKLLIVDQPSQVFAAYEHGRLVHWGPTSTGRQAKPTPSGRYDLNWRARTRTSTLSGEWRLNWYFNFQNFRGLAFHEFDLPGMPASHACVRLLARDAMWVYKWGESWVLDAAGHLVQPGTPVVIIGQYAFGAEKPWLSPDYWTRPIVLPATIPERRNY